MRLNNGRNVLSELSKRSKQWLAQCKCSTLAALKLRCAGAPPMLQSAKQGSQRPANVQHGHHGVVKVKKDPSDWNMERFKYQRTTTRSEAGGMRVPEEGKPDVHQEPSECIPHGCLRNPAGSRAQHKQDALWNAHAQQQGKERRVCKRRKCASESEEHLPSPRRPPRRLCAHTWRRLGLICRKIVFDDAPVRQRSALISNDREGRKLDNDDSVQPSRDQLLRAARQV